MNQKKSKVVLIVIIIVLVIMALTIAGIAYTYFVTDMFKSNKELFFKYTSQIGDTKNGFIDSQVSQYFEKKNQMAYEDNGTIDVDISTDISGKRATNVNNFNITFSGKVDTPNSKAEQDISINYSDNTKFPLSYRQTANITGLQTDYIGNKYISVKNDDVQGLLNKINVEQSSNNIFTITNLSNASNLPKLELSNEDETYLQGKYIPIINGQLTDNNFSKVEDSGMYGYKLSLSSEELKNILTKMLENLKDDGKSLEILNKYITSQKITSSTVSNWIKNIENSSELNNEKFEMTVYPNNGQVTKIDVQINEMKISAQKIESSDTVQYNLEGIVYNENGEEISKIAITANYKGLQTLANVDENYKLEISNIVNSKESKYAYTYNSNVNFFNDVKIENLTEDNAMILNNYDAEVINNFLTAIQERITKVNEQQMQEIGVSQNESPILDLIPNLVFYDQSISLLQGTTNLTELEISAFNEKFILYESTNSKGVTVKGLLSVIQANNEAQEDEERKIQEINFDGQEYEVTDQNIILIKSSIETETSYKIEFEKNQDTGIIYRVVINKK